MRFAYFATIGHLLDWHEPIGLQKGWKGKSYHNGEFLRDVSFLLSGNRGYDINRNVFLCIQIYSSPLSPEIKKAINNRWHIIQSDCDLSGLFTDPPLFVYSRPPNLRDKLVSADTHIPTPGTLFDAHGNFLCKDCVACSRYLKCKSFTHPQTGKIDQIKQLITCKTTHVI